MAVANNVVAEARVRLLSGDTAAAGAVGAAPSGLLDQIVAKVPS